VSLRGTMRSAAWTTVEGVKRHSDAAMSANVTTRC
jgi:hypothetical protein